MRRLNNFFKYHKRVWVPLTFILSLLLTWVILPMIFSTVFGLAFQYLYIIGFMAIQVVAYFGVFFYYLAGRIRIVKVMPGDLDLTWDDYKGQPLIVEKARAWTAYLTGVESFERMGGFHQPGILMVGPPGSGKTYLAKIIAAECGIPFLSVDGSSLLGTFVGIGPLKVARIFGDCRNKAYEYGGCILFIDEIDAIGGMRSQMDPGRGYTGWRALLKPMAQMPMFGMGGQILNTILAELDGFQEKRPRIWRLRRRICKWLGLPEPAFKVPNLMVIGSTNRPDMLDPALTRPGRLGRKLIVDKPTVEGLEAIAEYYLARIIHDETVTAHEIAMTAIGQTPAFIKFGVNDAVIAAHIEGCDRIFWRHWQQALAERALGDKAPLPLRPEERICLAVHEAGHAIVLMATAGDRLKPMVLTTERYGLALGHMYPVEAVQWQIGRTFSMLKATAMMVMAGMAAEEVFLKERHDSTGGDMPAVISILERMFANGMLGKWPFALKEDDRKALFGEWADRLYVATKMTLENNRAVHSSLVEALMERKELTGDDILEIAGDQIVPYDVGEEDKQ